MGLRLIENEIGEQNGRIVRKLSQKAMPSGERSIPGSTASLVHTNSFSSLSHREKYLTAATYITSRAFTSSLLPTVAKPAHDLSAYPILIPGVDSLNHARAHPVSWVVTVEEENSSHHQGYSVAIVHHIAAAQGQELLNNYGPKANAELVLGYGFSLPHNPDDTILLKIAGFEGQRWELGRDIRRAEGLWQEILSSFLESEGEELTYEDILDAAGSLQEMTENLLERLPHRHIPDSYIARPEVIEMFQNYIDGMATQI
jgi:hypothetical protein